MCPNCITLAANDRLQPLTTVSLPTLLGPNVERLREFHVRPIHGGEDQL